MSLYVLSRLKPLVYIDFFILLEDKEPTLIQDILDRYEVIENEKI